MNGTSPRRRDCGDGAITEEGTKDEAIEWLPKTWDELCDVRSAAKALSATAKPSAPSDQHRLPLPGEQLLGRSGRDRS
jgi:hypothetical protein